jgi:hypothetical protein
MLCKGVYWHATLLVDSLACYCRSINTLFCFSPRLVYRFFFEAKFRDKTVSLRSARHWENAYVLTLHFDYAFQHTESKWWGHVVTILREFCEVQCNSQHREQVFGRETFTTDSTHSKNWILVERRIYTTILSCKIQRKHKHFVDHHPSSHCFQLRVCLEGIVSSSCFLLHNKHLKTFKDEHRPSQIAPQLSDE